MTIFVYETQRCKEESLQHAITGEVQRLRESVEHTQSTSRFDKFPQPYLVKKQIGQRQFRLIAKVHAVGVDAVVVFLAVLVRGERDYETGFARDPVGWGEQHLDGLVSNSELDKYVCDRTQAAIVPSKPKPSDAEYALLYGAFAHRPEHSEELIYETEEWVAGVREAPVKNQLVLFCAVCRLGLEKEHGTHFIPVESREGWGAWVYRSAGRLLLITPVTDAPNVEAEAMALDVVKDFDGDASSISRASRRAYPAIILADDDLWIELELEPVGNMALSPEESKVLESARGPVHPFPLFINGRAGSGKSTILQYLFSDLMFYYLTNKEAQVMAPPIYLTANGELLRLARKFVERLLSSEAAFTLNGTHGLAVDNRKIFDASFRELLPHLLSLLPAEDQRNRFSHALRVNYSRFRRLWVEHFRHDPLALREYGPDISWHVIRSYIKGMSSEDFLEPADYAGLPEKQITVTTRAYQMVYDRVWTNWYQKLFDQKGLWDDQDLSRYVLENNAAVPKYPVVFCDEAQDFTRLDLEVLLKMNLFSDRALTASDISRVPFAFAGDQFQTLNPTGFRWDAIKASFVEKFIFELDPAGRSGRTDLNYCELQYNYRSTENIVGISNHVQAMRAVRFQLSDVKPQQPWLRSAGSPLVVWFRSNDAQFWIEFEKNPGIVIIVPCNEGEEHDYVVNDSMLARYIKIEDGVPKNVLSTSRAKGCEYPQVLVYGFGESEGTDIASSLLPGHEPGSMDSDTALPVQYFFNRLYVAVSRAKRRLIVVDTNRGFERLWRISQDHDLEMKMLGRMRDGVGIWGGSAARMIAGKPNDDLRDDAEDQLENAKVFERDGIANNDHYQLKLAALAYRDAGQLPKSQECRARALEAEDKYFEAGNSYFEYGFVDPKGVLCLWKSGMVGWERLCKLVKDHSQIRNSLEFQWSFGIIEKKTIDYAEIVLKNLVGKLRADNLFAERCAGEPIWSLALEALLQPLFAGVGNTMEPGLAIKIALLVDQLRVESIALSPGSQAEVLFSAQRYLEAIAVWDKLDDTKSHHYLQAKAALEAYPDRIIWLRKLEAFDELNRAYSAHPDISLSQEQATILCNSLTGAGHGLQALDVAWDAELGEQILAIAIAAFRDGPGSLANTALYSAIELNIKEGKWEPLVRLISAQEYAPGREWRERSAREWVRAQYEEIKIRLIQSFARSEELPKAYSNYQQQISKFLVSFLRVKDGTWGSRVSIHEAGAAYERAGRFIDTINFYKALLDGRLSKDDKRFVQTRLLVTKQRRLERERDKLPDDVVSEDERNILHSMQQLNIEKLSGIATFPELPPLGRPSTRVASVVLQLDPVDPEPIEVEELAVVVQERMEIRMGSFALEVSRKLKRCNIRHAETMETGYAKWDTRTCDGEVGFSETSKGVWQCKSWDMVVEFPTNPDLALIIRSVGFGVNMELRV